jgi:membrane associated rhomboid family serine protease
MVPAAVGFQCPRCVRAHAKRTGQHEGPYGGAVSADPNLTTIVIVAVNLAVWALIQATGGQTSVWTQYLGLSPVGSCGAGQPGLYYPSIPDPAACAAVAGSWNPGVATGAVWQLVTSVFTHVELIHLGCNLLTLWFLGPPLERLLGRARFLTLYFLAGLTGSAFVFWLSGPASNSIGASGAVFGLIAALLIIMRRQRQDIRQVLLWLGVNVLITLVNLGSISWQAHLGGFLGGAAITAILVAMPREARGRRQAVALTGYGVLLAAAIAARVLLPR